VVQDGSGAAFRDSAYMFREVVRLVAAGACAFLLLAASWRPRTAG
jgi:hypothetical protein